MKGDFLLVMGNGNPSFLSDVAGNFRKKGIDFENCEIKIDVFGGEEDPIPALKVPLNGNLNTICSVLLNVYKPSF